MARIFSGLLTYIAFTSAWAAGQQSLVILPSQPTLSLSDDAQNYFFVDQQNQKIPTTLIPKLQSHLTNLLQRKNSGISTVVVTSIKTGEILALVQGRAPEEWGSSVHTALYNKFPAASLFKTVTASAAIETLDSDPDELTYLNDECSDVDQKSAWLRDEKTRYSPGITLKRAFGSSCNSFFAKVLVNQLGLGVITHFTKLFGWEQNLGFDFAVEPSNAYIPDAGQSASYTVGRFGAGFGDVGISAVHASWIATMLGNNGFPRKLKLFQNSQQEPIDISHAQPVLSPNTIKKILELMKATVNGGTGEKTFSRIRYRNLKELAGGKTGTLTGRTPPGLTTLFMGLLPLKDPEIAVVAISVLNDRATAKATPIAAEAMVKYLELKYQTVFPEDKQPTFQLRKKPFKKLSRRFRNRR